MLLHDFVSANGGLVTTAQLRTVLSRRALADYVHAGALVRVCHGVYAVEPPDVESRRRALELMTGRPMVACMATAADFYGFDTENDERLHVLDPSIRLRPGPDLVVHQRLGAPLRKVRGRLMTAPAWTAVEVARALRRPRALATLDAALRSQACSASEMEQSVREQRGRRGIVKVRQLLAHADARAESSMESETRLVFLDHGVPLPVLQYEIVDLTGRLWRLDFAWPDQKVAAEYDSMEWHANPAAWKTDRIKAARLGELGWTLVPVVVDDVRRHPADLVARISSRLGGARLVG